MRGWRKFWTRLLKLSVFWSDSWWSILEKGGVPKINWPVSACLPPAQDASWRCARWAPPPSLVTSFPNQWWRPLIYALWRKCLIEIFYFFKLTNRKKIKRIAEKNEHKLPVMVQTKKIQSHFHFSSPPVNTIFLLLDHFKIIFIAWIQQFRKACCLIDFICSIKFYIKYKVGTKWIFDTFC